MASFASYLASFFLSKAESEQKAHPQLKPVRSDGCCAISEKKRGVLQGKKLDFDEVNRTEAARGRCPCSEPITSVQRVFLSLFQANSWFLCVILLDEGPRIIFNTKRAKSNTAPLPPLMPYLCWPLFLIIIVQAS